MSIHNYQESGFKWIAHNEKSVSIDDLILSIKNLTVKSSSVKLTFWFWFLPCDAVLARYMLCPSVWHKPTLYQKWLNAGSC